MRNQLLKAWVRQDMTVRTLHFKLKGPEAVLWGQSDSLGTLMAREGGQMARSLSCPSGPLFAAQNAQRRKDCLCSVHRLNKNKPDSWTEHHSS